MRRLFIGALLLAGLAAFAGTCTLQHYQLTQIGSYDTYAGEIHNDTGTNFLQHNVVVAFVNSAGTVVDTKTVTPCLRTLQSGSATYFSAQSSQLAANTSIGLARLEYGSSLIIGNAAIGSGTISNLSINRNTTSLTVTGKFQNTDSTTLQAPNACAVVYSNTGKVLVVGLDQSMSDLSQSASDTFSIPLTVPDSTSLVSYVNVYVDGLKNGVPTLPISDLSNSVSIGASKLAFTTQPSGGTGGIAWTTQPVVTLQNADGTTATGSSATVNLQITSGTGDPAGVLSCTGGTSEVAVNGIATFSGCSINHASGAYYKLTATSSGANSATSNSFLISVGAAAKVGYEEQPGGGTADGVTAWAAQPIVAIQDAGGNTVTSSSADVTLAITTPAGATLTCDPNGLTIPAVSGVATFAGCMIDKAGTYTLTASSSGLVSGVSSSVTILPQLVFTTEPLMAAAPNSGVLFATQPVVTLENADGSPVTGSTATVTLTASAGATLTCTGGTTESPVNGVATFVGCKITGAAGTYHLIANDSVGSTAVNSADLTIG